MNKEAFTLSEVLLVLSAIGVVAALTIPTLTTNLQDQRYKTAYKKAFSDASQAWNMALNNNLPVPQVAWHDTASSSTNFNAFMSSFEIIKECNSNNNSSCWATGETFYGHPVSSDHAFIDKAGRAWSLHGDDPTITLDVNGNSLPNKYGKDRFVIYEEASGANIPFKISPWGDSANPDANNCPSGSCWYTSWLTGAK